MSPARLVLRPFGYLLVGLVWTAAALALLALYLLPPVAAVVAQDRPLGDQVLADPDPAVGWVVLSPVAMVLAGPVFWYLSCATWPLAALSFVHLGRSLRPRYRDEPLSFTSAAAHGTTVGPPPNGVPVPLQPEHATPRTTTLVRFAACGWQPLLRELAPALPAGLGWVLVCVAALPLLPVPALRVAVAVAGLTAYAWSAVLLRRRWVWRFRHERARPARRERRVAQYDADGRAVLVDGPRVVRTRPQSREHRAEVEAERAEARASVEPLTALTSDAIGERRERALRAREERLRGEAAGPDDDAGAAR
ncbi:hypothetical protein [Cellulosimicrobium marinum]|uniref:hypothetical protein n=1 Tax=Cellulosimicrobium marinum TaxID=1638992 RepID=UPI001E3A83D6|nr:hypothetical protein [Cellulosimicrobium marinum]MCB7136005.1 hypothetical protein [Cellulosimicrobium marinum]